MSEPWYEVVTGGDLAQGDIILNMPIYRVETPPPAGGTDVEVFREDVDVIVLTQSCDLENDKVDEVLFAEVVGYATLVERHGVANPSVKSKGFRKAAIEGALPPYSLLPERTDPPGLPWSLVDFHHLFSVAKPLVEGFANQAGERLRLVPPYREHLAQAFARYIMRVGLPSPLREFERFAV